MAFSLHLLQLLADGGTRSGEELGEALGISRAAIWKQIQSLRQHEVVVDAVAGEGYRLSAPLDLLDADRLRQSLAADCPELLVHYEPVLQSTSQLLSEQIKRQGLSGPVLATTEFQWQGRGRRGRHWQAGFAQGVLLSVAMPVACGAAQLGGLSLACGVAVAAALKSLGVDGVQLKWPNDLLLNEGKLGGVLIELFGEAEGPCDVIVGIGLNVASAPDAGSLEEGGLPAVHLSGVSRQPLVLALAQALFGVLQDYPVKGFTAWRDDWQRLNAHQGCEVVIKQGQGGLAGLCEGVDEQGALLLKTAAGQEKVFVGDVSMRAVP